MQTSVKRAADAIPFCADQGMPTLMGASQTGLSWQVLTTTMPNGGVINFAAHGLQDMANADYAIIIQNHTNAANEGLVARGDRLPHQFTITNVVTDRELDIWIIGKLKGQAGVGLS